MDAFVIFLQQLMHFCLFQICYSKPDFQTMERQKPIYFNEYYEWSPN